MFVLQVRFYKLSPTMISLSSWWSDYKKRRGSRRRSGRSGRKRISTCKCRSASGQAPSCSAGRGVGRGSGRPRVRATEELQASSLTVGNVLSSSGYGLRCERYSGCQSSGVLVFRKHAGDQRRKGEQNPDEAWQGELWQLGGGGWTARWFWLQLGNRHLF